MDPIDAAVELFAQCILSFYAILVALLLWRCVVDLLRSSCRRAFRSMSALWGKI